MVTENATADHMAENKNTFPSSSCPVEIESVLHNASLQKLERFEESPYAQLLREKCDCEVCHFL